MAVYDNCGGELVNLGLAKKKKKTVLIAAEPETAYLTKRALIRAINKGIKNLVAEAIEAVGYHVTIKDGWVVKVDAEGNVLEKISKLKPVKRGKLYLD